MASMYSCFSQWAYLVPSCAKQTRQILSNYIWHFSVNFNFLAHVHIPPNDNLPKEASQLQSKHPRPFGRWNPACPKLGVPYQSMRWCASSQPAKGSKFKPIQWPPVKIWVHYSPLWISRLTAKAHTQTQVPWFLHRINSWELSKCQMNFNINIGQNLPVRGHQKHKSTTLATGKGNGGATAPHPILWSHPPRAWTFATSSVPLDVVVRHPGQAIGKLRSIIKIQ